MLRIVEDLVFPRPEAIGVGDSGRSHLAMVGVQATLFSTIASMIGPKFSVSIIGTDDFLIDQAAETVVVHLLARRRDRESSSCLPPRYAR